MDLLHFLGLIKKERMSYKMDGTYAIDGIEQMQLKLHPETIKYFTGCLSKTYDSPQEATENAGYFSVETPSQGGVLLLKAVDTTTKGGTGISSTNDVPINHFFTYHCHNNRCLSKQNCYFSLPSKDDLLNIYNDFHDNQNKYHIVVSHEGLYVVTVVGGKDKKKAVEDLRSTIKDYQTKFAETSGYSYHAYTRDVLKAIRSSGVFKIGVWQGWEDGKTFNLSKDVF